MIRPLHSSYYYHCLLVTAAISIAFPTISTAFTTSSPAFRVQDHTASRSLISSSSLQHCNYYEDFSTSNTRSRRTRTLYMSSTLYPSFRNKNENEDKEKKKKYSSFLKRITKVFHESPSEENEATDGNESLIENKTSPSSTNVDIDSASSASGSSSSALSTNDATSTVLDTSSSSSTTSSTTPTKAQTRKQRRPSNVKPTNLFTAKTLQEYKTTVADEKERMVVVRFYATYCRACKAIQSSFYRLADIYPNVKFVEVPCNKENSMLHQGLGIPSVPFGHIYVPDVGLVEEMKISKRHFKNFSQILKSYIQGSCDTPDGDSTNPYGNKAISSSRTSSTKDDHHPQDGTILKY